MLRNVVFTVSAGTETEIINAAGEKWLSWRITPTIPIMGTSVVRGVYYSWMKDFGNGYKPDSDLYVSSRPDGRERIIVDDFVSFNGRMVHGFDGLKSDPMQHIGADPSLCYNSINYETVTNDLRKDGQIYIQLIDTGAYTFCSSALYLIKMG